MAPSLSAQSRRAQTYSMLRRSFTRPDVDAMSKIHGHQWPDKNFPLLEHVDAFILEKCSCDDCVPHLPNVFSEYDHNKI